MNKKVLFGKEAREKVMAGIDKITKAVAITLGAKGRNVIISRGEVVDYGTYVFPNHVTKDGITVAKAFDLYDPFERVGVMAVKEASEKTVIQAGDGTTTTAVLLKAIAEEGMKLIDAGANPMELKRGIDEAVKYVVDELKKVSTPIKGDVEKIRQVATVSANNDSTIGDMIADAFAKIGEEGIIDVEAGKGVRTEIKISEGYKFNKGWLSPLFINRKEKQVTEFENPLILLYDKRVTHHTQVQKALELAMGAQRAIVIICEDAEQEGLAFLAMNTIQGRIQCCVVTAPEFGDLRREAMEDIATLTGGMYLSDQKGKSIKEITFSDFGQAEKIIISKDETVIIGGKGEKEGIDTLLNELRMNAASAKSEEEKEPIEKRIAKLTGGVAVIQVGAATETEMKERLDRFDDAVRATKAATAEGYVGGGGMALFKILDKDIDDSFKNGYDVVMNAIQSPFMQICRNAGYPDGKIVSIGEEILKSQNQNTGYNVREERIEDLIVVGIIDPTKVVRCALENAASAAGMILTSEAVICDTF